MSRPVKIGTSNILDAAERCLLASGGAALTIDAVAAAAKCAKGLVHYHFGTRTELLVATNDRVWTRRENDWVAAFRGRAPEECVRDTWSLLVREATEGVTRAWLSLLMESDRALHQAVRRRMEGFDRTLVAASRALLERLGLRSTIPSDEWSRLLAAGIDGVSIQLIARGRAPSLESDYAAVWLSALALTTTADA